MLACYTFLFKLLYLNKKKSITLTLTRTRTSVVALEMCLNIFLKQKHCDYLD